MRNLLVVPIACLLAAGCASEIPITGTPHLGETVRHNMAVHIVPLPPSPQAGLPIEVPAARTADAVDRYIRGDVKPLRTENAGTLSR